MILKFTQAGKFLMQIGKAGASKGSNDIANLRGPAKMWVDPKTNELYVADGYGDFTWGWWEKNTNGRRAVFRFRITGTPTLDLIGCCYPNGSNDARIGISADARG